MSASVSVPRYVPAPRASIAPVGLLLSFLVIGGALSAAVAAGGPWPLTATVLIGIAAAFVLVLRMPHVGISLFLTTFLINYPSVARGTGVLTINNLLGVLFLILLVWDFYLQREAWYVRDPLLLALLVVGAIFVLGTVAAVYTMPDEHIQALIRKPLAGQYTYKTDYTGRFLFQYFSRAAFVLFILRFVRTPRQLLWVFVTMLACIFFAVPFAVHSYLTATGTDVRALTRVVNWADNANRFAFGLLLGVAFLYYLTMRSRGVWIRVVALLGTVILIPVVLMSASRSGFMGMLLLAGLVLFGAFGGARQGSRRGALAVMALIAGVGVATYFTVLPARMQQRILNLNPFAEQPAEGSKSTSFRTATIEHSVEIIAEHPMLGVGLGNFRWVHKLRYGLFKPPHNSYLWALAEGGVPLLLAYLVIFAMLWRRLGKLRASYAEHPVVPRFPEWLRVYIVLLLFFSFFADVWIEEHVFLLIGATMLLDHWRRAYSEPAAAPAVLTAVAA